MDCGKYKLDFSGRPLVMGILNVTPDSFSDGGKFFDPEKALKHARKMAAAGVDIIDIGGESTRPFADKVSLEDELNRVVPVIEAVAGEIDLPVSVDTVKAEVAEQSIKAGASIINDISSLSDPRMGDVAAETGVPVILMHMQGTPVDMQVNPDYVDVVEDVAGFFDMVIKKALKLGIKNDRIIIDPGIGFGKTVEHNLQLIKNLSRLTKMGYPVLMGASRKSFIKKTLGGLSFFSNEKSESLIETGTHAISAISVQNGADIVRVHDVEGTVCTLEMIYSVMSCPS